MKELQACPGHQPLSACHTHEAFYPFLFSKVSYTATATFAANWCRWGCRGATPRAPERAPPPEVNARARSGPCPHGRPLSPPLPGPVPGLPPPARAAACVPAGARRPSLSAAGLSSRREPAAPVGGSARPGPMPLLRGAGAAGSCSSPARPPSCCGTVRWGGKELPGQEKKDGGDCLPPLPRNPFRPSSIFALAGGYKSISRLPGTPVGLTVTRRGLLSWSGQAQRCPRRRLRVPASTGPRRFAPRLRLRGMACRGT